MATTSVDELARWPVGMLDQLQQGYRSSGDLEGVARVDAAIARKELGGIPQTADVSNCGKLFRQRHYDPDTGRIAFTHTGDIGAFLKPFTLPAREARVNRDLCSGENSAAARAHAAEQRAIFADGLAARAARVASK